MLRSDADLGAAASLDAFVGTLRERRLFERGASLAVSRAPGRLDVMGGIADYSGSLVLQRPIAEATFAAAQRIDRPVLELVSLGRPPCTIPLETLAPGGVPVSYDEARRLLRGRVRTRWAAYVAGVFLVLARERGLPLTSGARIVVASQVPEGKGVSSSAAIETASMPAVATAFGLPLEPRDLALLCQKAENLVAGAPCGVMDQMTCVFGERDALLALLCQPAELQRARARARRCRVLGTRFRRASCGGRIRLRRRADGRIHGAANPEPSTSRRAGRLSGQHRAARVRAGARCTCLPEEISGDDFLGRYGGTADTVTTVEPGADIACGRRRPIPSTSASASRAFRELLLARSRRGSTRRRSAR